MGITLNRELICRKEVIKITKILNIDRLHGTFNIMKVNFKTQEAYSIILQFTFKDPWLLPKYNPHFGKADIPLYGWLFFYFGRITEGVVIRIDSEERIKIRDGKGNGYYLYTAKDRAMRDSIRTAVKSKMVKFRIETNENNTTIIAEEK